MRRRQVVNILFHGIGEPRRPLEPGEAKYWVGVDRFHQLLDEVAGWPSVRISFDDSNSSDLEIGLPALRERGLTATFFVIAGRLGQPGSLTADDVRELRTSGMRVGSHGMWHRPWRRLGREHMHEEFVQAREIISAVVGAEVDEAACPLGRYDRAVLTELRRLRYQRVFTSDQRPASPDAWVQARYSVLSHHSPTTLRAAVVAPGPLRRMRKSAVGVAKRWR